MIFIFKKFWGIILILLVIILLSNFVLAQKQKGIDKNLINENFKKNDSLKHNKSINNQILNYKEGEIIVKFKEEPVYKNGAFEKKILVKK